MVIPFQLIVMVGLGACTMKAAKSILQDRNKLCGELFVPNHSDGISKQQQAPC